MVEKRDEEKKTITKYVALQANTKICLKSVLVTVVFLKDLKIVAQ